MTKKLQPVQRRLTDAERQRHAQIREAAQRDFPAMTVTETVTRHYKNRRGTHRLR